MDKSQEIALYGPPGLVAKASGMFRMVDGSVNIEGISVEGMCPILPKDRINDVLCRLRLRCVEPDEVLETCGYVSDDFVFEAMRCWEGKSIVTIAGETMVRHPLRKKSKTAQYYLLVEVIEDSSPF